MTSPHKDSSALSVQDIFKLKAISDSYVLYSSVIDDECAWEFISELSIKMRKEVFSIYLQRDVLKDVIRMASSSKLIHLCAEELAQTTSDSTEKAKWRNVLKGHAPQ